MHFSIYLFTSLTYSYIINMPGNILTTSNGNPVDNDQTSLTAGTWGPVLLQDFHLIDKLSHFDRERIPERVVHAKGAGAHGEFGKRYLIYYK